MPPAPLDATIGRRLLLLGASAALITGAAACASSTPNGRAEIALSRVTGSSAK